MKTLIVDVNKEGFEYDIHSLIKAFFPECDVKVMVNDSSLSSDDGLPDIDILFEDNTVYMAVHTEGEDKVKKADISGFDRSGIKNILKKLIYISLSEYLKVSLPWGTLTGIRPTKIPMTLLCEGADITEIEEYMKDVYLLSDEKTALSIDIAQRERELLKKIHYVDGYSVYIGIPFCPTTCLYCSFTSFPIAAWRKRVDEYLAALEREIEFTADFYKDKFLDTIYIGGGTPTTLSAEELERLLSKINATFDMSHVLEFTVEAGRADSITIEKLKVLKAAGVTRISVNPQTMNQKTLDFIGRRHTVEDVLRAYKDARDVGFDNINMDIILGLPGENEEEVSHTIDEIMKLKPESLTVHSLAIKRASRLAEWIRENGMCALNNTDKTMKIAAKGAEDMGMKPYYLYRQKNMSGNFENVGYSIPGKEGIYNILIMEELQTIVALGAGSVTKRVYGDGRIERCDNVKDVGLYIEKIDEMIDRKRKLLGDDV